MTSQRAGSGSQAPGTGGDYDPITVPVRDAATVLILDERPDLHVLMLKRNARSVFVGDMWVFPGRFGGHERFEPSAGIGIDMRPVAAATLMGMGARVGNTRRMRIGLEPDDFAFNHT